MNDEKYTIVSRINTKSNGHMDIYIKYFFKKKRSLVEEV